MSSFITPTQHSAASSSQFCKIEKEYKRHTDWKETTKPSLFAGGMVVCVENPKESTKNMKSIL